MRDNQRSKVYSAEQSVRKTLDLINAFPARTIKMYGSTLRIPEEYKFGSFRSVAEYVWKVESFDWYPESKGRVCVRPRKGDEKAHYQSGHIYVHPESAWALREIVVLHELAHHLTRLAAESHGAEFAGAFLWLVENVIGHEVAFLLRTAFYDHGVKIKEYKNG